MHAAAEIVGIRVEEVDVLEADAGIGLEAVHGVEVVLQGDRRREDPGVTDIPHRKPRFRPNTARTSLASQRLTTSEFTFFANRAVAERLLHPPADAGQAAAHPGARVATATRKLLMQIKH
jgi:hypothetical protein